MRAASPRVVTAQRYEAVVRQNNDSTSAFHIHHYVASHFYFVFARRRPQLLHPLSLD